MSYDPRFDEQRLHNPRYLGPEPEVPEPIEEAEFIVLESLTKAIPALKDAMEMFSTEGWDHLQRSFQRSIADLQDRAVGAKTYDELCEYRGRIMSYKEFLGLPSTLKIQLERALEAQARLMSSPLAESD